MKSHALLLGVGILLISGGLTLAQQMQSGSPGSSTPKQQTSPTKVEPTMPAPADNSKADAQKPATGATTGSGANPSQIDKPGQPNAGSGNTPSGLTPD